MKLIIYLSQHRKTLLLFIFSISILIQLIFLSVFPPATQRNQSSDYLNFYEPAAQNILIGKGIVDMQGNLSIRYPPGYPVILSIIFELADLTGLNRFDCIAGFNVLITAFSCILIFLIAELIFNTKIGIISSLIWISYPFNLWLIKQPNSEIPFMLFFYSGILYFISGIKKKNLIFILLSGVALAMSALIRPIGILFGLLFAIALLFYTELPRAKRIFYSIILLIGFIITVLPWEFNVLSSTEKFIPLSSGGPVSITDGLTFAVKAGQGGQQAPVPKDVMNLMKKIANKSNLNTTGNIFGYMLEELKNNPLPVLKLFAIKVFRSWYGTDEMWHENYILLIQFFYVLMAVIGFILGIKFYKDRILYMIFLLTLVVYFWAMTVVVLSIVRYMIPAMITIIIFSAVLIENIIKVLTQRINKENI